MFADSDRPINRLRIHRERSRRTDTGGRAKQTNKRVPVDGHVKLVWKFIHVTDETLRVIDGNNYINSER